MATLVTYTMASGQDLSNITVRATAMGRLISTSGTSYTVAALLGTTIIAQQNFSQLVYAQATAYLIQVHFYFSTVQQNAGNAPTMGASLRITLSNPIASGAMTGGHVSQDLLSCLSNPYLTPVPMALAQQLSVTLTPPAGGVIEQHCGYMEAL